MLPYFYIGDIKISSYYSAMVLGYVLMAVLMLLPKRREKYGLNRPKAFIFATIELLFGILGCKILFILENISWVIKNGLSFGGFSFFGAAFLISLAMPLFGKLLGLSIDESLDSSAICIIAMLGTIRLGCFLNGCCGGRVFFVKDYSFTFPVQLIECVCDFLILFYLLRHEKKKDGRGFLYPLFLLMYGVMRFFIEFLRNTAKDWLYLSHAQWFSVLSVALGVVFILKLKRRVKSQG